MCRHRLLSVRKPRGRGFQGTGGSSGPFGEVQHLVGAGCWSTQSRCDACLLFNNKLTLLFIRGELDSRGCSSLLGCTG